MSVEDTAPRVIETGTDPRSLGRWTWLRTRGKGNLTTRIITCYCPVKSSNPGGAYSQQLSGLTLDGILDTCPRDQFWIDLADELTTWKQSGDQIIISGDWNSRCTDVRKWFTKFGLRDAHAHLHGSNIPRTYKRSQDSPIDGIYCSSTIKLLRGGFLSFGKLDGDHRGIWLDIHRDCLLGYGKENFVPRSVRRLNTENPITTQDYTKRLHQHFLKYNVYVRIANLRTQGTFPLSSALQREFERLDLIIRQGQVMAERRCRRIFCGGVKWSPQYKEAFDTVRFWTMMVDQTKGIKVNSQKLMQLQKRYRLPYSCSAAAAARHLNQAHARRREVKYNAENLSMEYRARLAEAKASKGKISAATHLLNMNHREHKRSLFRRIRFVEGKQSTGSTSFVTRVNDNKEVEEITSQKELERAIIKENLAKYHQTEDVCPLLQEPLKSSLGRLGEAEGSRRVLNGTFIPPLGTPDAVKAFLRQLKKPSAPHRQIGKVSLQQFITSWTMMKEKTSSMGAHFGHFIAASRDDRLAMALWIRSEIPLVTGYSPDAYRKGTDCMILKKANSFDISMLRTIVLMDSEFNHSNKQVGKQAMDTAIALGEIVDEQYSRPGRKAIDHALNRRLIFDYHLFRRSPFALGCSDLKSCYDRVAHAAVSLALQRLGVPVATVVMMFDTIQRMVHQVRTAFGDSTDTYGGDEIDDGYTAFPQGFNQGNGLGPQGWTILSSVLFKALKEKGYGMSFIHALTKETYKLAALAYVDDCDLIVAGDTPEKTMVLMQESMSFWEDLVQVTGGRLQADPKKTTWYLIDFVWKKGKFVCNDPLESADLQVHDKNGQLVSLKRLLATESMAMLGIYMNPANNNSDQVTFLRQKTSAWADRVQTNFVTKEEAATALKCTITASLRYPLPTLCLTEAQCTHIMAPLVQFGLPRCGLSRSTPAAIRDAPSDVGGGGLLNLFHWQGCARISALMEHSWKSSPTSMLLQANIQAAHLESGLPGSFFQFHSVDPTVWMSNTWITSTLQYARQHKIGIPELGTTMDPWRTGDRSIMLALLSSTTYTPSQMKALNRCRMELKVFWMSEISLSDGIRINTQALQQPSRSNFTSSNQFLWPTQSHTTPSDWSLWRRAIRYICTSDRYDLPVKMTMWNLPFSTYINNWEWFCSSNYEHLWQHQSNSWYRFIPYPSRRRRSNFRFFPSGQVKGTPPNDLIRVSVSKNPGEILVVAGWPNSIPKEIHSLLEPLQSLLADSHVPPSRHWIFHNLNRSSSIDQLLQDFINGTCRAGTDGSFFQISNRAGAAWRIESQDGSQFLEGGGPVPCSETDGCSYRSELGGLLGIILVISFLEKRFGPGTIIKTCCDSLSALQSVIKASDYLNMNWSQFDLLAQIQDIRKNLDSPIAFAHVSAHQDSQGSLTNLSPDAKLNVRMDLLAKEYATARLSNGSVHPRSNPFTVTVDDRPISSNITRSCYALIMRTQFRQYLEDKGHTLPRALRFVAWKPLQQAKSESSQWMHNFILKFLIDQLGTAQTLFRWKLESSPLCCRCSRHVETADHVIRCKASLQTWDIKRSELDSWMSHQFTDPALHELIMDGLDHWFHNSISSWTGHFSPDSKLPSAFASQQILGWRLFLCGYISQDIIEIQADYYSDLGSRKSPLRWATNLIKVLWRLLADIWIERNQQVDDLTATNDEYKASLLNLAIKDELHRGIDGLPSFYEPFFRLTPDIIVSKSIFYRKQWYRLIKTVRIATDTDIENVFSCSSRLQRWAGIKKISPNTDA